MELVVVRIRPFYGDKKMHVLRFLLPPGKFSVGLIKTKLRDIFPYGFYEPSIERFMIDYVFESENERFVSLCNHDYLSEYLTSSEKLE